jgi:hypothetical protein
VNPGVTSAIVDRVTGCRKVGIGEGADGDANTFQFALLSVEEVCSADGTEAEPELSALITGADVLCGLAEDPVWGRKACKCCEDTACSLLAGEAMADTDKAWLTFNFDTELPTVTRSCSG